MTATPDDDRLMLQAIHDYCLAKCQAAEQAGNATATAEHYARKRAYAAVARATRELLDEL